MPIIVTPATESTSTGGMTFVQLVQRLRRRCRVAGAGNIPVTLTNQNEEISRLIDFINEAWLDIQNAREDWQWMRSTCSFTTIQGQATYTPTQAGLIDWGNWTRDTWRSYYTTTGTRGEILMDYIDYEDWRNLYQFGATRVSYSQPFVITITPDKQLGLGPVPLSGYTVTGDYFTVPTLLVDDTDTPTLPSRFQMAIVYRAMMFYGVSEAAPEVYQEGKEEFDRMMMRLTLNQMPDVGAADSLA
jgi:hypothetical protein